MSGASERLRKRKPRKVEIDGDEFWVRSMTLREVEQVDKLSKSPNPYDALTYAVAACLVNGSDDDEPAFTGPDDPDLRDVPTDKLRQLADEIGKASTTGSLEKQTKNSDATG